MALVVPTWLLVVSICFYWSIFIFERELFSIFKLCFCNHHNVKKELLLLLIHITVDTLRLYNITVCFQKFYFSRLLRAMSLSELEPSWLVCRWCSVSDGNLTKSRIMYKNPSAMRVFTSTVVRAYEIRTHFSFVQQRRVFY